MISILADATAKHQANAHRLLRRFAAKITVFSHEITKFTYAYQVDILSLIAAQRLLYRVVEGIRRAAEQAVR
jgi:hypothetical protein